MTFSVSFSGANKVAAKESIAKQSATGPEFAPFAAGVALVVDALPQDGSISGSAYGSMPHGPGDSGSLSVSVTIVVPKAAAETPAS